VEKKNGQMRDKGICQLTPCPSLDHVKVPINNALQKGGARPCLHRGEEPMACSPTCSMDDASNTYKIEAALLWV
jgi:hypothetical protein